MFRGIWAALRPLIPRLHRHEFKEEPLRYNLQQKTYSVDRVCSCGRRERRRYVRGAKSGDAVEIVPDVFSPWVRVKGVP